MNELTSIRADALEQGNYTLSILQKGILAGSFSPDKLCEIRRVFQEEFCEIAAQYTKRESSSVCWRIGKRLYASVLFQSDAYLHSIGSDDRAIQMLVQMPTKEILQAGKKEILRCFEECKRVFRQAYRYRLKIPIPEYRHVMETAFFEFCASYSARFAAQELCTSIDYPLLCGAAYELPSNGVFFMKDYYTAIKYENLLCSLFKPEHIIRLLLAYGQNNGSLYIELYFNICEVVLKNFLAARIRKKAFEDIFLSPEDLLDIRGKCMYIDEEKLCCLLNEQLTQDGRISAKAGLPAYLKRYVPHFVKELRNSVQNGTLRKFLVCEQLV